MMQYSLRYTQYLIAALTAVLSLSAQTRPSESKRTSFETRTLIGDHRLEGWRVAIPVAGFKGLGFDAAAAKVDELGFAAVVGSGPITRDTVEEVRGRLRSLNLRMLAYETETLDRATFTMARGLDIETLITSSAVTDEADRWANEFSVNVAFRNKELKALEGRSNRLGLMVDAGTQLTALKSRLMVVNLGDASSAKLTDVFREIKREKVKPIFVLAATSPEQVAKFESAVQPVHGEFMNELSATMPVLKGDTIPADVRAKIDAALPRVAQAKPKKPRKLLVMDLCPANMTHDTIPHGNYAIEKMGKLTGAYEAVLSNDLNNLKWDKIRQFDAIFLNDTVGEVFADPEVRASLMRFIREGGGIGGLHGASYVSRNWREFSEMLGGADAPHRIEPAWIKLDDPKSPINAGFDGAGIEYVDEYYRFPHDGPRAYYSREKLHVLLSIDMDKSDLVHGKPMYERPDKDYAIAWIRSYGKGRVYNNSLGHTPTLFSTPKLAKHILGAIQYLLGDLEADATPSAQLARKGTTK